MFSLPDDIMVGIIENWSDQTGILKLDTACCNSVIRPCILRLFMHDGFSMQFGSNKNKCLKWILQRNIQLSIVNFDYPKNFISRTALRYPISLSKVKELTIHRPWRCETDISFAYIINDCIKLTHLSLQLERGVNDELFTSIAKRLPQLQLIDLYIKSPLVELTPMLLQILAENCRSLESIRLIFQSENVIIHDKEVQQKQLYEFRNSLIGLLNNNQIKELDLNLVHISEKGQFELVECVDSWGLFEIISDTCPSIEICKVDYCGSLNTSHVANLFKNNKQLRQLQVENHSLYGEMDRMIRFDQTSEIKRRVYCADFCDENTNNQSELSEARIESLFAWNDDFFTDVDLGNIEGLTNNLIVLIANRNCHSLVHLSIGLSDNPRWSLSAIVTVLTVCRKLTSLELKDCDHLQNDDDFKTLYTVTPHALSYLAINNSSVLKTETVSAILKHYAIDWDSFECEYCPLVDDNVLFERFKRFSTYND
jgi:hypothetical protein